MKPEPRKIEVYGCGTIESAFRKAKDEANNLRHRTDLQSEWSEVYRIKLKLVSIEGSVSGWSEDDDDHPTFVWEATAE
jgi:hypothetical protein